MTQAISVDGISFDFPDDWTVAQCDTWSYYRNNFIKMKDGIKSMDVIAVSTDGIAYLIELKDYRIHRRAKPTSISSEILDKVIYTLAMILPASINASDESEKSLSKLTIKSTKLRIVLHLEQPLKHSKLYPRAIDPADVTQKLRQILKPIDAHPVVTEMGQMRGLPWTVS